MHTADRADLFGAKFVHQLAALTPPAWYEMKVRITRDNPQGVDMQPAREGFATTFELISRIGAGLLGSFGFSWGFITLGTVLGVAVGFAYEEALTLLYLFAFLVFATAFCWSFTARSHFWVWAVLAGGGAAMTALAWIGLGTLM